MSTNLVIDEKLVEEAVKIGEHKTRKEAVTEALKEYISKRKQKRIKKLFGKIEYNDNYNYKKQRSIK